MSGSWQLAAGSDQDQGSETNFLNYLALYTLTLSLSHEWERGVNF